MLDTVYPNNWSYGLIEGRNTWKVLR